MLRVPLMHAGPYRVHQVSGIEEHNQLRARTFQVRRGHALAGSRAALARALNPGVELIGSRVPTTGDSDVLARLAYSLRP